MPAESARFFVPDFATARAAFLRAAEGRGARIESHVLQERGPEGGELAVDAARLGPEHPRRLIVVSSGVHGVEGHTGSAVQRRLLEEQLESLALPADTGLLLIHAVNPYGYAHTRRVNESNVDLNRNFVRHPEEHVASPDYDALAEHINPDVLDDESEKLHFGALLAYAQEHGFPKLQAVLTEGQYRHPEGVQFGGAKAEASNRILRDVTGRHAEGVEHLAWLDIHTGLGPSAEVEMISELPLDAPGYLRGRAWYGDCVRSTRSGDSVSAALHGTMELGVEQSLDPSCELTIHAAEFGTYEPVRVFRAMRADNWLHHHGRLDSDPGRALKAELLEVFRPADPKWQARVLDTAATLITQTRDGLCAA